MKSAAPEGEGEGEGSGEDDRRPIPSSPSPSPPEPHTQAFALARRNGAPPCARVDMKACVLQGGVQLPAPIQVRLNWRSGADASPAVRDRVHHEIVALAWELSQAEALLGDVVRVAGFERAYLMPRIELRLPLYDENRRLRIVFSHIDEPRIHLVDEEGKRLADVVLL